MWAFLVDEDMPRDTAEALRRAGYTAEDVRDVGFGGRSDDEIFAYAQTHEAIVVTQDMGFSNVLSFPLGTHAGIIVMRVPNALPISQVINELLRSLAGLEDENLVGLLVIVEIGRTRIRRLQP